MSRVPRPLALEQSKVARLTGRSHAEATSDAQQRDVGGHWSGTKAGDALWCPSAQLLVDCESVGTVEKPLAFSSCELTGLPFQLYQSGSFWLYRGFTFVEHQVNNLDNIELTPVLTGVHLTYL